jgi:periplasmic divalent cation tolerance protein
MSENFQIVLTTCPTAESAERIARLLIEARLAACVNVIPGLHSYYEWKGKLERSSEHLLVVKTRSDLLEQLQSMITSAHPYELPEIIAVPITAGSHPYLAWMDTQLRTKK